MTSSLLTRAATPAVRRLCTYLRAITIACQVAGDGGRVVLRRTPRGWLPAAVWRGADGREGRPVYPSITWCRATDATVWAAWRAGYLRRAEGGIMVGGTVVDDPAAPSRLPRDAAFVLTTVGERVVCERVLEVSIGHVVGTVRLFEGDALPWHAEVRPTLRASAP